MQILGWLLELFPKFFLSNRGKSAWRHGELLQGVAEGALGLTDQEMMPSEPPKILAEAELEPA